MLYPNDAPPHPVETTPCNSDDKRRPGCRSGEGSASVWEHLREDGRQKPGPAAQAGFAQQRERPQQ